MKCPKCGGKLFTLDTVNNPDDHETYRQLMCTMCGEQLYSVEFEAEDNIQFRETFNKYRNAKQHASAMKKIKGEK